MKLWIDCYQKNVHLKNCREKVDCGWLQGEDARANLCYFADDERFIGFCDRSIEKQKIGVDGYQVISPEELLKDEKCKIVISTHTHRGYDEIRKHLLKEGVSEARIYHMTPYMCAMQGERCFNRIL